MVDGTDRVHVGDESTNISHAEAKTWLELQFAFDKFFDEPPIDLGKEETELRRLASHPRAALLCADLLVRDTSQDSEPLTYREIAVILRELKPDDKRSGREIDADVVNRIRVSYAPHLDALARYGAIIRRSVGGRWQFEITPRFKRFFNQTIAKYLRERGE